MVTRTLKSNFERERKRERERQRDRETERQRETESKETDCERRRFLSCMAASCWRCASESDSLNI